MDRAQVGRSPDLVLSPSPTLTACHGCALEQGRLACSRARSSPLLGGRHRGFLDRNLLLGDPLVHLPELEGDQGLQEACSVVRARRVRLLQQVLRQFSVELGPHARQVRFYVDELLFRDRERERERERSKETEQQRRVRKNKAEDREKRPEEGLAGDPRPNKTI